MTDLVSLLFITMIHIDCKITNFSLHLYIYFVTLHNLNYYYFNEAQQDTLSTSIVHT